MLKYLADLEDTEEISKIHLNFYDWWTLLCYGELFVFADLEVYYVDVWMNTASIYCQLEETDGTESDVSIFSLGTSESKDDECYVFSCSFE